MKIKYFVPIFLSVVLSGCDALKNDPFKVTTTTLPEQNPEFLAGMNACTLDWAPTVEALHALADRQNAKFFKAFADSIPAEKTPKFPAKFPCSSQAEVANALDLQLDTLQKWSNSNFEFVVMLVRLQHIAEGALSETMCVSGSSVLKKDAKSFLKAIRQERSKVKNLECFVAAESENEAEQLKIFLLKVKDKDLIILRDEMVALIKKK